ncbi:hypothetical protein JFL43_09860 [Viridibacillus sp. YIM B01967]|uniref:Permease n=1 Tax=Viridibacillus soli TaxID=2798301 RepID=A0ABS1H6W3_9BACL|nr:hypothetical protein [Viridibacillus soli]MBK3495154.1 hypothetical protein [Viridibacillus soli]
MSFLKPKQIVILCGFTILFVMDFFSQLPIFTVIPKKVIILLTLVLILISFLPIGKQKTNALDDFKWHAFLTGYLVVAIIVMQLLGGKSSSGISFNNGFVLLVAAITIWELRSKWRKVKQETAGVEK